VIPVLLLENENLVKTVRFENAKYIGDPVNAVRIFNEKRVDELMLLDIRATPARGVINEAVLGDIASEAFMPVAVGGGISTLDQVERILKLGVEKVVVNSAAYDTPSLVTSIATRFGSQSVIVSMDVRKKMLRSYRVYTHGGRTSSGLDPAAYARRMADAGAGEVLVTAIEREGTGLGYDLSLIRTVSDAVDVPVIANGGASSIGDFAAAVRDGHAAAVAASSMFIYQGKHRAVLISFPDEASLRHELFSAVN
jgi:cyclase